KDGFSRWDQPSFSIFFSFLFGLNAAAAAVIMLPAATKKSARLYVTASAFSFLNRNPIYSTTYPFIHRSSVLLHAPAVMSDRPFFIQNPFSLNRVRRYTPVKIRVETRDSRFTNAGFWSSAFRHIPLLWTFRRTIRSVRGLSSPFSRFCST